MIKRIKDLLNRELWERDTDELGKAGVYLVHFLRAAYVIVLDLAEGHMALRAMSLVYTTLLALVPLLAVSFSVLKAFGVHNQLEPLLLNFLKPLGPKGQEISVQIVGFVQNVKVGVLGAIGLSILLYTVVSLVRKIEGALNEIWRTSSHRNLVRRFSDYTSLILVGPVLMFSAVALTASITSNTLVQKILAVEPFGTAFFVLSKLTPYVLVCAAFTFVYIFLPNTKVRFRSALTGGVVAGVLWETVGWVFATFIVSTTKYTAIYSGFAILILMIIWMQLSWLILLAGAQIAFYHQYPQTLNARRETFLLSNHLRERLVLMTMYLIGDHFCRSLPPWNANTLVSRMAVPLEPVQRVLSQLEQRGLVTPSKDEPPAYLPARDPATIKLRDIIDCVRYAGPKGLPSDRTAPAYLRVEEVMNSVEGAIDQALLDQDLKAFVLRETPVPPGETTQDSEG